MFTSFPSHSIIETSDATMAAGLRYGKQLIVDDRGVIRRISPAYIETSRNSFRSSLDSVSLDDDDMYWYKTGIRGRKKYLLYFVIVLLFLVALANIVTTFALMGVLRLGYGMEGMEFIPEGLLIRFLQSVSIDVVVPTNGVVGGFKGENLNITGNDQPVILQTKHEKPTSVVVAPHETSMLNVNSFKVINPETGQIIFSTGFEEFDLPKDVNKLNVHQITVNKITSPVNSPLSIDSDTQVRMRGNEGLHMVSLNLELTAGEDVDLKSRNGSIIVNGASGVHVLKLPKMGSEVDNHGEHYQYKICVCMPSGKLFRIRLKEPDYTCENVNVASSSYPCR